jgi:hypothetical protein
MRGTHNTRLITFFITILFVCLTSGNQAQHANNLDSLSFPCQIENTVFSPDESITYSIYYNLNFIWLKAGEVVFTVKDLEDQYHFRAVGRTASSFEWFYKVRDVYEVWVDKESLMPIRSIRDIREGRYKKYSTAEFDHTNGVIRAYSGKTKEEMKYIEEVMDDCTHNVLSIIYHARNLDYPDDALGAIYPANIFMDDDKYNLGYKFDKREEKRIRKLGKFNTIKLVPQIIDGHVFKEGDEMKVWATDDDNKLPLLIESPVSVGSVKVVLKEYKSLKYPLDARL